jgi:hypothetical protein
MRKQLIALLVGTLILFIWQFLSWSLLNVHGAETQYTANQDAILEVLSQNLEEGQYMVPTIPPGTSSEESMRIMQESDGKPWAMISYHESMDTGMGLNLVRGFVVDFVAVFVLVWLLSKFEHLDFRNILLASLAVGLIGYLTIPYLYSIWYKTNTIGYVVDLLAQWGLIGAWLGWYIPRKS